MNMTTAKFARNEVRPGWTVQNDDVKLGKLYVIDLDTIHRGSIHSLDTGESEDVLLVFVVASPNGTGWLPLFIFDFPEHEAYDNHLKG